jgi:hypothetical protein
MKNRVTWEMLLAVGFGMAILNAPRSWASEPSVFGVFCGSSPCGEPIRQALRIPTNGAPELIEWKLTLYQDATAHTPSRYELHCDYGLTVPNKPGLAKDVKTLERQGTWTLSKGTKSNPDAVVYEFNGAISLLQVDSNILHVLNPDRTLMIGNGGWSYTLNRTDHAEKRPEQALMQSQPDMSYQISPLATGPTVFGVFEGRSPCQGIARELKKSVHAGSAKVKWRVTLYQNPETLAPTTYKVESSLHRRNPREGDWSIVRGTQKDPNAIVYRLAPTKDEAALFLLKGDDNVLFFLDQSRNPLVGHCEFSYTLNRRTTSSP